MIHRRGRPIAPIAIPEDEAITGGGTPQKRAGAAGAGAPLPPLPYFGDGSINVVLDPGALVLQLSNVEFARRWLKRRPDMEAVVFFDDQNVIRVLDRDHLDEDPVAFSLSPYAEDMRLCLLYLDDVHTRGSDFRLPLTTRALLTLGKGMTKDKFLQACMRMRQIGSGQSLSFCASKEVHRALQRAEVAQTGKNAIFDDEEVVVGGATTHHGRSPTEVGSLSERGSSSHDDPSRTGSHPSRTGSHPSRTGSVPSRTGSVPSSAGVSGPKLLPPAWEVTNESLAQLVYVPCILSWTLANTRRRICDLVPYFSAQGRCNINKLEAYRMFYSPESSGLVQLLQGMEDADEKEDAEKKDGGRIEENGKVRVEEEEDEDPSRHLRAEMVQVEGWRDEVLNS